MTSEFERGVRAAGNWMRTHAFDIISRHADEMIGETLHYSLDSPPAAPAGDREAVAAEQVARRIVQAVSELPDRASLDDWPEEILVASDELYKVVVDALKTALVSVEELRDAFMEGWSGADDTAWGRESAWEKYKASIDRVTHLKDDISAEAPYRHASDCAVHNEPAMPNGSCDCRPNIRFLRMQIVTKAMTRYKSAGGFLGKSFHTACEDLDDACANLAALSRARTGSME